MDGRGGMGRYKEIRRGKWESISHPTFSCLNPLIGAFPQAGDGGILILQFACMNDSTWELSEIPEREGGSQELRGCVKVQVKAVM